MPARLLLYADVHCPYAYLASWRLRKVLPEYETRVEVVHKSLAIEHADRKPTPKDVLDAETPIVLREEPGIPYRPWSAPAWTWPVTMWPAFEAVKCAERQSLAAAHELDWRLREAFFARSRCISLRHVLLEEARAVPGLDVGRFERDFDDGVGKPLVLAEAREGWETLGLEASPTFVLPDGSRVANPAGPLVHLDEEDGLKLVRIEAPSARGDAALDVFRRILDACARSASRT